MMKKKKGCKKKQIAEFEIGDLLPIGMTLVVLTIGLAYGLSVTSDVKTDMAEQNCLDRSLGFNTTTSVCYNSTGSQLAPTSAEYNATSDGMTGLAKIPEKLPTIVTVIVAAVIIGILVRYLWKQFA